MAEIITKEQLENASLDADSLEVFVSGSDIEDVLTRLGREYPTLAKLVRVLMETGGWKAYQTEAALIATTPTVNPSVGYAFDTKKLYLWNGTTWIDEGLSQLDQSKAYADANPLFKQVKIVAGNNFNNFTKPGIYYHWGVNLTEAQVPNGPLYFSGNLAFGVLIVTNPLDTLTSACSQVYYSMYDGFSPMFRKAKQDGTWPTIWDNYTLDSRKFNTIALTTGQDVLTLKQGRYNIPSITIGNSLLNMPSAPYKFGIVEADEFSSYKVITFKPYGRDASFYSNASYEAGAWSGWVRYTPNTAGQINAMLKALTGVEFYGKKYSEPELNGTAIYPNGYYVGYNSITGADGASFNALKARIYNASTGNIEYRVYTGSAVTTGSFGYNVSAANQNNHIASGICTSFPKSDSGSSTEIILDNVVTLPANSPFVIMFRATDLTRFGIAHHTAVSGNLESRGFDLISTSVDWGVSNISNGTVPGFTQAGFQLLLSVASSGGDPTPQPEYAPSLVLASKCYALEGLETHIYPEHLLVEDYKLYEYDITCTKGKQALRGFVWTPTSTDVAGTYSLAMSAISKNKGLQLNSVSTSLVLAAKNAKSGQSPKVSVIGDSLVAAGTITQRLLDISATDVMGINLIGTRGTGSNKHEGRGGYTINDYTTVGRTYYQFTVSGVVVPPALNATTYTYGGSTFLVQEVALTGGSGTIICSLSSGSAPTNGSSGTLTKSNGAAGDATIAFSNVQAQSANPFWNNGTSSIDYPNYLSVNSLSTPDIVLIELGINDIFGLTNDGSVVSFAATAFPKLDTLITSIKAANASVKIGICQSPCGANQDAFGANYLNGQTSWRFKRNIVIFMDEMHKYFKNKEAQNIFFVPCGINVDTENNYPTATQPINSHNSNTITVQSNGVHPADSGYKQIGDAMYAFLKAV